MKRLSDVMSEAFAQKKITLKVKNRKPHPSGKGYQTKGWQWDKIDAVQISPHFAAFEAVDEKSGKKLGTSVTHIPTGARIALTKKGKGVIQKVVDQLEALESVDWDAKAMGKVQSSTSHEDKKTIMALIGQIKK